MSLITQTFGQTSLLVSACKMTCILLFWMTRNSPKCSVKMICYDFRNQSNMRWKSDLDSKLGFFFLYKMLIKFSNIMHYPLSNNYVMTWPRDICQGLAKPNCYWKLLLLLFFFWKDQKPKELWISQHLNKTYLTCLWQLWLLYLQWAWSNFKRTIKIDFCISSTFVLRALIFLMDGVSNWQWLLYYKKKREKRKKRSLHDVLIISKFTVSTANIQRQDQGLNMLVRFYLWAK